MNSITLNSYLGWVDFNDFCTCLKLIWRIAFAIVFNSIGNEYFKWNVLLQFRDGVIRTENIHNIFMAKIEIMRSAIKEIIRIVFQRVKNRCNGT